jgi:hypothetical protein
LGKWGNANNAPHARSERMASGKNTCSGRGTNRRGPNLAEGNTLSGQATDIGRSSGIGGGTVKTKVLWTYIVGNEEENVLLGLQMNTGQQQRARNKNTLKKWRHKRSLTSLIKGSYMNGKIK